MLRKFYRFIRGITKSCQYPPEVEWMSIAIPNNHKKLPEELLTEEEILKIIQKCGTLRDKALISLLAESGCRVGEIGAMKIKHVSFEKYGARITVGGKTGMRKILVINSSPYLQEWINQHPTNEDSDSYLWCGNNTELISYARICGILGKAVKKAGIKKRVYPHLFRHSRATFLANRMSDSGLKNYLGWTQASKMAGIYIHMSGKDADEAILKMNGIEVETEKIEECLNIWVGPDTGIRDFEKNNVAIEVKTTQTHNHQKIRINSERQLDTTLLEDLFLFHLSLEKRNGSENSLNIIVHELFSIIGDNKLFCNILKRKLISVGYFTHHEPSYENISWMVRGEDFYSVKDEFPRVEEKDLMKGVGDVKYSIVLTSETEMYKSQLPIVINKLNL